MTDGVWKDSAKESLRPAGISDDLPDDVRDIVGLPEQTKVIAWTSYDPKKQGILCCDYSVLLANSCLAVMTMIFFFYGFIFGPIFFWLCIPLVVLSVPVWVSRVAALKQRYWVISENHLFMITKSHDMCSLIPGCCRSGSNVLSVPLENIVDCGVTESVTVCFISTPCKVYINTIHKTPQSAYEYTALNLSNYKEFVQAVLNQRNLVKDQNRTMVPVAQC
jgi:hypothetical protein